MIWALVVLVGALVIVGAVGFAMGLEYAPWSAEKAFTAAQVYKAGLRDGRIDGAQDFAALLRVRAVEAKNTWTITKTELDRLEKEMTEYDPE